MKVFLCGMVMLAVLAQASAATPAGPPVQESKEGIQFSARVIWRNEGDTKEGQLFVKGGRYRFEPRGGVRTDLGYAGVTIVRQDQQEVWYVLSQRRSYLALPLKPIHLLPFAIRLQGEIHRTLIGEAMAGGRAARLFEVVVERYGGRETYFEWVDAERGLVLRLLSKHRDWSVEYQHVVFSEQPSHYFEVPRGYRRIEAQEQADEK